MRTTKQEIPLPPQRASPYDLTAINHHYRRPSAGVPSRSTKWEQENEENDIQSIKRFSRNRKNQECQGHQDIPTYPSLTFYSPRVSPYYDGSLPQCSARYPLNVTIINSPFIDLSVLVSIVLRYVDKTEGYFTKQYILRLVCVMTTCRLLMV